MRRPGLHVKRSGNLDSDGVYFDRCGFKGGPSCRQNYRRVERRVKIIAFSEAPACLKANLAVTQCDGGRLQAIDTSALGR